MADGSRSSCKEKPEEIPPATWVRWIVPSVADLIFIALLCAFAFTTLSTRLLGDAGIGWHIRTGQQIAATHAIPRLDPFSSTMAGKPWIAWEWLYDVVVGTLGSRLGLNGVIWFTGVVIAAVFAWTFQLLLLRGTNLFVAVLLLLLAISASMIHFLARPHVLTWLFAVAWFWVLDSTERDCFRGQVSGRSRRLWFLPVSMLLWANVHGGFLVGFVLLAIFWMGAVGSWWNAKDSSIEESFRKIALTNRIRKLAWVGFLSAAASLANPYGWNLHRHIFSYLTNRFFLDHIDEFQSPNFHGVAQKCFLGLLLIAFAALAAQVRKLTLSEGLLLLFAIYSGLYSSRNIPISSILLVLIVGPLLPRLGRSGYFARMSALDAKLRGHVWPILALLFVLLVAINRGKIGSTPVMDAHFDPKRMPVYAVNYIEQRGIGGPVLSPDYWGGYLIYRLYPKTQVVIDDRHDLYGQPLLESYVKMMHVRPGWEDFLKEHQTRCLLVPKDAELSALLAKRPGWQAIYADDTSILFMRTNP